MTGGTAATPRRDYVSPGLVQVSVDDCFPGLRPVDPSEHPWPHLRRDVPHTWLAHERAPSMGVLNRDEAALLHTIALGFAGREALEIGGWIGWSTCHLALAGVAVDTIDPAHEDDDLRAQVQSSLDACGVASAVNLAGGSSPGAITDLAAARGRGWSLFFIDGDHEGSAPLRDALACLPHAAPDCAFVFHDVASPDVAAGLRALAAEGFRVVVYQTAQIMGMAWRGDVAPVRHVPDPAVAWPTLPHLAGLPTMGVDFPDPAPPLRPLHSVTPAEREPARPSVCIVSNEFIGPFRNGGIGTAMTGLAEGLASEGFDVTLLYTGALWTPDVDVSRWRGRYAKHGITFDAIGFEEMRHVGGPVRDIGFAAPYLVYRYLRERQFDVVHVNDCCGDGYLAMAASRLGIEFDRTLFVMTLHSPSQWVTDLNQELPTSLLFAAFNYAERLSARCADVVLSPSRYMAHWARDNGLDLPEQTFVQQYRIPSAAVREDGRMADREPPANVRHGRTRVPSEIVFFGRLEERKGLPMFCDAIDVLAGELAARNVSVTFLGKPNGCGGETTEAYLTRRSADWPFATRMLTGLGQPEALDYLRRGDKLAVIASPLDNSPCTVYETLASGVPLLAARTGGIPELIADEDHEHVLFDYEPGALGQALRRALDAGAWVARPAVPPSETHRALLALHEGWRDFLPPPRALPAPTMLAAAVVDHHRGDDLQATLDSLEHCGWFGQVLVLDRDGVATGLGDRRIDLAGTSAHAAAAAILGVPDGPVLLIHSGVAVLPAPFEELLSALQAGPADGLQPAAERRTAAGVVTHVQPLGGSPAFSLFEGPTYTGGMLVHRRALVAALQGGKLVADAAFLGLADLCVAGGADVWPYPRAVLRLPRGLNLGARRSLPARVAAYANAQALDRYYMLAAGYGARSGVPSVSRRREIALALGDSSLALGVRVASRGMRAAREARARVAASKVGSRRRGGT